MKKVIIYGLFFSLLLTIPLPIQARDIDFSAGEKYDDSTQNVYINELKQGAADLYNFGKELSDFNGTRPSPQPTDQETTQDSNIPENYDPDDPSILNYATRVVSVIHKSCSGGYVNASNALTCLNNLSLIMKPKTIEKLKYSATTYTTLQCVACADAMAFERGRALSSRAGSAKLYLNLNLRGYRRVYNTGNNRTQVTPDSLFITTGGTYGHMGYVVEVAPDKSWFRAFECNAPGNGYVRLQIWDMSSPAGWQIPI